MNALKYIIYGVIFGILLTKSEVISWYRIQEMFRFQSFHMYGIIGSAILTAAIGIWLLKRKGGTNRKKEAIEFPVKEFNHGTWIGGILFGLGWAMTGACPGPLFAHLGAGILAAALMIIAAISGTWTYGHIKDKLPH